MNDVFNPDGVDFFTGVGVEKAATSWIYACLYDHPQVCAPLKEVNWLLEDDPNQVQFHRLFEKAWSAEHRCYGEFSTEYFGHPSVLDALKQYRDDAKVIVNLRSPASRAYSQYVHDLRHGNIVVTETFEQAIERETTYLTKGHYHRHLGDLLARFPRGQVHIGLYEDVVDDPSGFLQRLYQFLGIDSFQSQFTHRKVNEAHRSRFPRVDAAITTLAKRMHLNPLTRGLWWTAKKWDLAGRARKFLAADIGPIDPGTKHKLQQVYKEDQQFVEELLGRKLTW